MVADSSSHATHEEVMNFRPAWEQYGISASQAALLRLLEPGTAPLKTRAMIHGDLSILQAAWDALQVQEVGAVRWLLTFFQDLLREDSSCFTLFDEALKQKMQVSRPLLALLDRRDSYICDAAAWVMSAVMGCCPAFFPTGDVAGLLAKVLTGSSCTESGKMDAIANLLKQDKYRSCVWNFAGVADTVLSVDVHAAQPQLLYRSVFAIWLITFDKVLVEQLVPLKLVARLRDILLASRVEKVVRISLTVVRSLLGHRELTEQMVEMNILDAVQALEFEKWRDAELYDEIREVGQQIANQVQERSNFERYERELQSGALTWSSVHTSKFWGENVLKFEQNDFRAVKTLAALLMNPKTDPTTLAVACHDVGEFCTLHPLGKKKVAQFAIKERIMELMSLVREEQRELRREALLCCQKIMLNKWQDIDSSAPN